VNASQSVTRRDNDALISAITRQLHSLSLSLSLSVCLAITKSTSELYTVWSELSRRKLSPTSATAHYCCPNNAIGLLAQCELSGHVKLGQLFEAVDYSLIKYFCVLFIIIFGAHSFRITETLQFR